AKPWLGDSDQVRSLVTLKDSISKLLVRAGGLYESEDVEAARAHLTECDEVEDACDDLLHVALAVEGHNGAGLALTARYFKRVVSHSANVVTSIVMPLDKLDFFDEP
ncbi:MAG: phosphate uptake regulator, partial [Planctomycetota bacterium]